ncbi:SIR2 family protein [Salmonella enterica]|nr:SIR2 family protein [Salmonella enterica]
MIKLGAIEFDECLLDAIREEKLVIFAGAGVSKGSPSNLDDFVTLANKIAEGTGLTASVPLDRFLGELHHQGVSVHQRTVPLLTPPNSRPTSLHKDLIRLFKTGKNVRVVTTNFDLHFENAFESIFTDTSLHPHVYHAPALPRGQRFHGIVHVHGSIEFPEDMVLTDADFGRAYLTEGWARQFLVEVFRSYTVLFVGYSHDDMVMNYLARALPSDNVAGRFALTDKKENWRLLGITPLLFTKDAFSELNNSVKALADWTNRGALAWQTRITDIAREIPPTDIENDIIGEIRLILSDPSKTRCFTAHARHNKWVYWLEQYGYLKPLFEQSQIDECHILLMNWLIKNFVIEQPNIIYRLIAAQGVRLNPTFWSGLIKEISLAEDKIPEPSALKRWVTILLSRIPEYGGETYNPLMWLAEQCSRQNQLSSVVSIFQVLIKNNIVLRSESFVPEHENIYIDYRLSAPHYHLNEIWEKYLEPHVQLIHASLLTSLVCCFENIHQDFCSWDRVSTDWDPISDRRAAIEPHEQDRHPEDIDALIDITRDILRWLIVNNPTEGELWIAKLSLSEVAVLRRIAIHTISERQDLTAEKRLEWLLDHFDLYSLAESMKFIILPLRTTHM